tara:strand:+ start:2611 stop:2826 length:216 start_codon:yes stop_codon:yes gene_type:complete
MITKVKQWGNSMALIIPRKDVKHLDLKPNEEVEVNIEKRSNVLKEFFGTMKFKKPTEQILKEARKNTSKWD